jgi:hypothetical protein
MQSIMRTVSAGGSRYSGKYASWAAPHALSRHEQAFTVISMTSRGRDLLHHLVHTRIGGLLPTILTGDELAAIDRLLRGNKIRESIFRTGAVLTEQHISNAGLLAIFIIRNSFPILRVYLDELVKSPKTVIPAKAGIHK